MDDRQHPVTLAIRKAIEQHETEFHGVQWYVDDNAIDCNADEFWAVVDEAVRARVTGWAQNTSDAPQPLRLRPDSPVINLPDITSTPEQAAIDRLKLIPPPSGG